MPRSGYIWIAGVIAVLFVGVAVLGTAGNKARETAAVDELTLQPGGASVRYGRGLGGVSSVTSRTRRGESSRVGAEVSLLQAAAVAEGPGPARGSWLHGVRRS